MDHPYFFFPNIHPLTENGFSGGCQFSYDHPSQAKWLSISILLWPRSFFPGPACFPLFFTQSMDHWSLQQLSYSKIGYYRRQSNNDSLIGSLDSFPTNTFTQNPSIDQLHVVVWKYRSTDFKAPIRWKGRSGLNDFFECHLATYTYSEHVWRSSYGIFV